MGHHQRRRIGSFNDPIAISIILCAHLVYIYDICVFVWKALPNINTYIYRLGKNGQSMWTLLLCNRFFFVNIFRFHGNRFDFDVIRLSICITIGYIFWANNSSQLYLFKLFHCDLNMYRLLFGNQGGGGYAQNEIDHISYKQLLRIIIGFNYLFLLLVPKMFHQIKIYRG